MGITVNNSEINNYYLLSSEYMPDMLYFSSGLYNLHNNPVNLGFFFSSLYLSDGNTCLERSKNVSPNSQLVSVRAGPQTQPILPTITFLPSQWDEICETTAPLGP